jgi:hypothetical protein
LSCVSADQTKRVRNPKTISHLVEQLNSLRLTSIHTQLNSLQAENGDLRKQLRTAQRA